MVSGCQLDCRCDEPKCMHFQALVLWSHHRCHKTEIVIPRGLVSCQPATAQKSLALLHVASRTAVLCKPTILPYICVFTSTVPSLTATPIPPGQSDLPGHAVQACSAHFEHLLTGCCSTCLNRSVTSSVCHRVCGQAHRAAL